MAQASTFTQAIADEICERLSGGEPLRQICRDEHMPAWRTVYLWRDTFPDFDAAITHARDIGTDAIAEDTIAMIDETPERCGTQFGDKVDAGHVAWQKNRVEQRLKLLAKWNPKKYGDLQRIEHSGAVDIAANILEARKRSGG